MSEIITPYEALQIEIVSLSEDYDKQRDALEQECATGSLLRETIHAQEGLLNNHSEYVGLLEEVVNAARSAMMKTHYPHADSKIAVVPARELGNALNVLEAAGNQP